MRLFTDKRLDKPAFLDHIKLITSMHKSLLETSAL